MASKRERERGGRGFEGGEEPVCSSSSTSIPSEFSTTTLGVEDDDDDGPSEDPDRIWC